MRRAAGAEGSASSCSCGAGAAGGGGGGETGRAALSDAAPSMAGAAEAALGVSLVLAGEGAAWPAVAVAEADAAPAQGARQPGRLMSVNKWDIKKAQQKRVL